MLKKTNRIKERDVTLLYSRAKTLHTPLFSVKVVPSLSKKFEAGISASKKIFKTAVLRNRARRRLYGAIKKTFPLSLPYQVFFVLKKEVLTVDFPTITRHCTDICTLLQK